MSGRCEIQDFVESGLPPEFPDGPTDAEIVAALKKSSGFVLSAAQALKVDSHQLRRRVDTIPALDEARCQAARNLMEASPNKWC